MHWEKLYDVKYMQVKTQKHSRFYLNPYVPCKEIYLEFNYWLFFNFCSILPYEKCEQHDWCH